VNKEAYYEEYDEIDLREYIRLVWREKKFIAGLTALAILAALFFSIFIINPIYETEATFQLGNTGGQYSNTATVIQFIKSAELLKPIMDELDQDITLAQLNSFIDNIDVSNIDKTNIIRIRIRNKDPELARGITDRIISSLKKDSDSYYNEFIYRQEEYLTEIDNELQVLDKRIEIMNTEIDQIDEISSTPADRSTLLTALIFRFDYLPEQRNNLIRTKQGIEDRLPNYYPIKVISSPYLPEHSISPNVKLNTAIAGLLGLMLGVFLIFFREYMKEDSTKN
jgi:capsular polysaccharide biosynthesis protein